MQNDSTLNPDFDSIYSPETQSLIESTGLNVKLSDLSEISALMDDTAGQANLAMDSLGSVTQELAAAAKKDEKQYVEKSRGKYKEELLTELNGVSPYHQREYHQRLSLENQAHSKRAETIEDPRVWHAVNNRTRKTPWGASYKLQLTEELGENFGKEELYLSLQLNDYVSSPDGHRTDFATGMLELHRIMSKKDFKGFCEALIKIGKENEESADKKFKLIYSLKDRVAENFKLAEAIFGKDIESKDNWILEGKDFFKADPGAFSAFFRIMKELVTHVSDYHLGKEAILFLYWLPLCGSSTENLKTLKELLPKLHRLGYAFSDESYMKNLAEDPHAFEKLKISSQILPPIESEQWAHEMPHFLNSLKTRSVAECEAVVTWAKANSDDEGKILGSNKFHLLRRILGQNEVFSSESIEAWGVEFKKIKELLATEFKKQKTEYGMYITSEYDLETKSWWILNGDFHAKVEKVKKIIEDHRELQRKNQPDITKEEWGYIDDWIQTSILWRLSEEDREEVKEALKKLPPEKLSKVLQRIHYLSQTYKEDYHSLIRCIEVLGKHSSVSIEKGVTLNKLRALYEEDLEEMDQVFTVLDGVKGEDPDLILETLADLNPLYEKDSQKLSEILDVLNSMAEQENAFESLRGKCRIIKGLDELYGDDIQKLNALAQVLNGLSDWDHELADSIIILKDTYKGEIASMKKVTELLLKYKKNNPKASLSEFAKKLCQFKDMIREDPNKIESLHLYMEHSQIIDQKVVEKFVAIHEAEGEEAAKNYLEELKAKAKGLISSGIPEEQRAMEEYKFLVQHVYPKGNYSDHEKNLACGDHLEHIEAYQFDRKGYPIVLSGLQGYGLKNGEKENPGLLNAYSERLQKMRGFVSSRGPDNKLLQEAFDKKIAGIFEGKAEASFKEIKDLSTKEKLFCLIVSEAIRKAKEFGVGGARTLRTDETKVFEPDEEILDLVVEYKYAYHEDLEAYVLRSADDAKQYGDKISQNFVLWSELSVIYGENMKHVMKNEIMEKINSEPHFRTIVDSYVKTISELTSDDDVLTKARERIKSTLENAHIPAEKRAEVIWKQVWTLFCSNLKFASPEQGKLFEARMREVLSPFLAETSPENLEELLPKLLSLRNERRFDIGAKVEELLSRDIGFIFKELAKYEELAEVEAKETSMNGPKHKIVEKSAKKRNIRGHITKTQESANARMGAYLCIAGDTSMWQNPNYFELVLEDEETNRCVGVAMMLKIDAEDGKKYLWFGPNPFESFLTQVSAKKTYDYMYKTVCNFASENGFDGVVVPAQENKILGACTNRGGEFPGFIKASRLKDEKGNIKVVQFGKNHTLGGSYGYTDGALVWQSTATHST